RRPPSSTLFPSPTLFRSVARRVARDEYSRHVRFAQRSRFDRAAAVDRASEPHGDVALRVLAGAEEDRIAPKRLAVVEHNRPERADRKSTRLNSSHRTISY